MDRPDGLTIIPLRREHLPLAWLWNGTGCSFAEYAAHVTQPQWLNFLILRHYRPVACVMLERTGADRVSWHLAMQRRAIRTRELCRLLLDLTEYLFRRGFRVSEACIPSHNRAARMIAHLCGMTLCSADDTARYELTAPAFFSRHVK